MEQDSLVHQIFRETVFRTKGTVELGQGYCKVKAETLGLRLNRQTDREVDSRFYLNMVLHICFLKILDWGVSPPWNGDNKVVTIALKE